MSVVAEVKTGNRRVIEYFLSPLVEDEGGQKKSAAEIYPSLLTRLDSERLCRHPLMRICRPSNDNVPEAVPQGTLTGTTLMILPSTDISLPASSK